MSNQNTLVLLTTRAIYGDELKVLTKYFHKVCLYDATTMQHAHTSDHDLVIIDTRDTSNHEYWGAHHVSFDKNNIVHLSPHEVNMNTNAKSKQELLQSLRPKANVLKRMIKAIACCVKGC